MTINHLEVFMKKRLGYFLMMTVCCLLFPILASATPVLTLQYDGLTQNVVGTDGFFSYDGAIGRFSVQLNGIANPGSLALSGHATSFNNGQALLPLIVTFSEDNAQGGLVPINISFGYFSEAGVISDLVKINGEEFGPYTSAVNFSDQRALPNPFAMSEELTFSNQGSAEYWFGAGVNASPAPEPSSLILLGSGLIGAAAIMRRKRNS